MAIATFTILELATASVTIAGGIALILRQIQHSRCRTCNFCCNLCNCEREVPREQPEPDIEMGENPANTVNPQN